MPYLMKTAAPMQVKATDDEARTFTGLASTWDLDLGGDVIERGAFRATLADWKKNGRVLPLLDSHNGNSVRSVVGKMVDGKETTEGLEATFEIMEGPDGDEVYRRIKGGYVDGLSIGYEARAWEAPDEDEKRGGVWRKLTEVNLMEVSVCLWPMNLGARIADVKTALDRVSVKEMDPDDYKLARELASRLGSILRHAPSGKSEESSDDEPPTAKAPDAEPEDEKAEPPAEVPEAPPSEEADAPEAETAPEYLMEALTKRLRRLNEHRIDTEEDEE